jgi:two-component system, OmpR family, response regulator
MQGVHVLVVDDDEYIREMVATAMRYAGFRVSTCGDGRAALAAVPDERPQLVVLDVAMPDLDGFEVCRRLRSQGDRTPIIFLTAKASSRDVLEGFGHGGDDYVVKPFVLDELVARVRAVMGRAGHAESGLLRVGDLELDEERHAVTRGGSSAVLTPTEFALLRYLMTNANRVVSKDQIMDRVWRYDFDGDGHVVETYMSALRRKLGLNDGSPRIRTVRGVGYVLEQGAGAGQ